jgi:hypothetical protein
MRQAWLVVSILLLIVHARARAEVVTVTPAEDDHAVLHNPDMGWVLYENYPVDPTPAGGSSTMLVLPGEKFEGVDEVAIMFSWFDVEKVEGTYDFSAVDKAYDYWKKFGKRIQLRMSTQTLLWWDNATPPRGKGPPDYVVNRLPPGRKQRRDDIKCLPPYDVVDTRDPYYLQRLEKFLAAVADHYRGERAVTLIDLRGFGVWGENHSGFKYKSLEDRRDALIEVYDRYSKAFKDNWVALSYSYDPDGPPELYAGPYNRYDDKFTNTYDRFVTFSAYDVGLTKPNITWRRDGAGGAVHSNERKFCEQAFLTLKKGPFFSEFMEGYAASKKGAPGWVEWKVDDALSLHPNYINLLGYQAADALQFMRERIDLFELGLRTMGYRLVPTTLTYPGTIEPGETFEIAGEWVNRGVGRAMRDFVLRASLTDASGKAIATIDAKGLGTDKWVKGKTYKTASSVTFKALPAGRYSLALGLIDPRSGETIRLPLKRQNADGLCPVGEVTVSDVGSNP